MTLLRKRIIASLAAGVMAAALAVITPSAASQAEVSAQACTYTNWVQGQWYTTGSIVKFENAYYIAEHDNPGYSPTVSTWYWDPYNCDGGGGGGGSCAYTDWVQGQWYVTGAIVRFEGSFYIAEHDNPGYSPTVSTWYWDPYNCDGGGGGGGGGSFVVSEAQFNQMFPSRNGFYSYSGLVTAMSAFPAFAKTGSDTVQKQEAAAFLANVSHETGGLVYIEEINKNNDLCDESKPYGCPAGTYGYYGRGPIQLSWNFNYYSAGQALGMGNDLLNNPGKVASDAAISWKTGLWYWMTQTGPGTMTGHNAMVNGAGFGQTIRSINGSLECDGRNPAQVQSRVDSYNRFVGILGVGAGANLYC